jgi:thiol-disulfide isomerase/thioredoxin
MKIILPLLLIVFFARAYSQPVKTTFTIQGTITPRDSGRMFLMPINTEDYYPSHGTIIVPVVDGQFSFTDSISYPTAYMLGFKIDSNWKYLSNDFFVEPGIQALYCNTDTAWTTPAISNRTMDELRNGFIKSSAEKSDSALLSYVRKNPGSYVAFWRLVHRLAGGYAPFDDSLYNTFADSIRQTYTGRILKQKLDMGRTTCIGCRLSLANRFSTYTLIDVWFSHCDPCLRQFEEYKEVYAKYRNSGFQLIAVSTDPKDQIPNWKKVINQHQLPWLQYLDEGGTITQGLSIISWPSNFLLDAKGVIIRKNISPKALAAFLTANIPSR